MTETRVEVSAETRTLRPPSRRERGGVTRRPLVLLVGAVLGWLLFHFACVGRPQEFRSTLRPKKPPVLPDRADVWPVRVALFNVWGIPVVSDDLGDRVDRMPKALRATEADVICLQEVWTGGTRENIAKGLEPSYVAARSDSGGLMVLSRFPILEERYTPFPGFSGLGLTEWIARKGILEVVVKTPAGPVRVVTTHLALAFGEGNPRTAQLRYLLEMYADAKDLPVILAADLNTPPVRGGELMPDYLEILDGGFTDAKPPRKVPGGWDPGPATREGWPRPARRPHYHPDHVLVRPGQTAEVLVEAFEVTWNTPETALSDHNLLIADLKLLRK